MSREYRFALLQDGLRVAEVSAPDRDDAWRQIMHYAAMYGQDGPVMIQDTTRKPRRPPNP